MAITPPKTLAAVLMITGLVGAALPRARATVAAVRPAGAGRGISIIMLPAHPSAVAPKQLAAWVHQLSSPHAAIRGQAKHELIAAGAAAGGPVKAALAGWTTPQMRMDMRQVLAAISQAGASRGPLVTLKLAHAPLAIILKRLCIQAGLTAQFAGTNQRWTTRRVTIDVQQQPFWKVIQRIAWLTDVSPTGNDYFGGGLFTFAHPGAFDKRTPIARHGALLLAVQGALFNQTLSFAAPRGHRRSGGFSLNIIGLWAPGNSQVLQAGPAQLTQAIDNRGKSLLSSATAPVLISNGATYEYFFSPNLRWPSVHSSTIKVLKGQLPLTIATGSHIMRVGHLKSGKASINMSGIRIIFGKPTGVVQDPFNSRLARCTVRVTVVANANEAHWSMGQRFVQALPSGQSLPYQPTIGGVLGFESKSGRRLWCRVGRHFNGPRWSCQIHIRGGLPATAWAKFSTRLTRLHVPFVFHNVPIPGDAGAGLLPTAAKIPQQQPRPVPTSLIMRSAPTHRHGIGATKAEIARWIHHLSSPRANRRRLARRHLILAGGAAILQIQDALGHAANAALQRRCLSILDSIAMAGDLRGPLVTLQMQHPTLPTVIRRLCLQAGITPHLGQLRYPRLAACNIQRQPFWRVLQRLSHLTGIGPTWNPYNNYQLRFGADSVLGRHVPSQVHGAGVVALASILRYQHKWLAPVDPVNKRRTFQANLLTLWAPTRDQILEQVGSLSAMETITDAHGKALRSATVKTSQDVYPQAPGDAIFPLQLALHWPPPHAAALALRGTVRVYLAGALRTLQVNNLGFGHAAIQDLAMNLVFGKLKRIPGGWQIPLRISDINSFFYHGKTNHWLAFAFIPLVQRFTRDLFGGKELRLFSAHGHALPITAHAGGAVPSRGWGFYHYTIQVAGGKPRIAKIRFFTSTVLVKLPFDFKGLPIPR